jgi:ABC-type bacteriocin/lantibiotic exporter with double-glycine peptidase domain
MNALEVDDIAMPRAPATRVAGARQRVKRIPTLRADVLAVSLIMHVLALALPLALLQIYDRILPSQSYGTAVFLVIGVGIAILLEAVLRYGRTALFARLGARYEAEAMLRALRGLMRADLDAVEQRGSAAISDALRAIAQVRDFWSGQAGAALYEAPFAVVYLALVYYIGGWLVLIPLLLFLISLIISLWSNGAIARAAHALDQDERARNHFAWSSFAALNYVKAIGAEGPIGAMWRRRNDRYLARSAVLETRMGWVRENAVMLGQLSTVLIVVFGAIEVIAGQLTTGALAACTMLSSRSIGPAMASLGFWSQLARVRDAQARVDDLLNLPPSPTGDLQGASPDAPVVSRGELRIEAPALLAEPLTVAPGEIVHLATDESPLTSRLLTRIAGLSEDSDIRVELDGVSIDRYGRDCFREAVVLVTRHLALVPGSVLNNLTLYDPRYNADVAAYSERLGLSAHVQKLRHGMLTEVGPGTAEHLDEGIYQRIAIIRALLRRPRILLLDHAATGIDLDGVKRLAGELRAMQGHTTVLLATFNDLLIDACTRRIEVRARPATRPESTETLA